MTATISETLPQHVARPKVSVVIPALNEARNLPLVAGRMPAGIDEIIFVNGDSQDNTAEVARRLWPNAVHIQQTRKGKGNALACGFAAASGDIIVMIDADGSTDPAEIPRFVDALVSGAHFAKGSRFMRGGGSTDITRFRRLGNKRLNNLVNLLFTTNYTDLCYGFNGFWRQCLDIMCLPDVSAQRPQWGDGFEIETLMSVRLAASHAKVVEVASYEFKRIYGVSNLNAVADGLRVLSTIQREFFRTLTAPKRSRSSVAGEAALLNGAHSMNGKTNTEVVLMNSNRDHGHYLRYPDRRLCEGEVS